MTKTEIDMMLGVVDSYIKSVLGKYTPSELALADFERRFMAQYSGYTKVNQTSIRELVTAIKQAFAAIPTGDTPSELTYDNGTRVFGVSGDTLMIYNANGSVAMSVGKDGVRVLQPLGILGTLTMSESAKQTIRINVTPKEIDDLWT